MMVPQDELPILEALVNLKHRLTALKKDTTRFIRAKDVMSIYQHLVKEVMKLNTVRDRASEENMLSSSSAISTPPVEVKTRSRSTSRGDQTVRPSTSRQSSVSLESTDSSATARESELSGTSDGGASSSAGPSRTPSALSTPADEPTEPFDQQQPHDVRSAGPDADAVAAHLSTVDVRPPNESNRVDQVLNDVFTLLSLFFLTIGKKKESPGTFCQIASMRQLLDHMNESGIYTQQDLQPFANRLNVLKTIIRRDREEGRHPEAIFKLMMRKLEDTERLLQTLLKSLSVLSVELVPIHQRLVHIRRQLAALAVQLKPTKTDIKPLVEELRKIDSSRVDGKFLGPGGSSVPTGQAILVGLLEECFEICQDIRARDGEENVSPPLKPVYERLSEIKAKLERLQLTHRWTLRETDLYNYAQALREVESMRVDGSFVDADGRKAEGQYVLLYLLRRCHGLIYRLIAESEPISEELMPIANKLSTVKKCLNEVLKYGGPFSARDLYPYHLALHQIESLRRDGKFLSDDGSIPEGQAILVAQLSEAHEILEMLKEGMGDDEDDSDDDDDDEEDDEEADSDEDGEDTPHVTHAVPSTSVSAYDDGGLSVTTDKMKELRTAEQAEQQQREDETRAGGEQAPAVLAVE